jgi:amidohydrolase
MPIINRVAALAEEVGVWRRDLHAHPELGFDVHRTAAVVAEKLESFGCDKVVTGIGKTGVVAIIRGRKSASNAVIGLRADMDALPIQETTKLAHASKHDGKMHACGHDGHTAMLLGAARYLAETRNFDGTAILIFQPAEEGGGGARLMVQEGIMDRFGIDEVYGMHNWPGVPTGQFAIRPGPLMAAADKFDITIDGRGSHAAQPHLSIDTLAIGCQVHQALQMIVSRNVDPLDSAVVSVTMFHAGAAHNIIPQQALLAGTVRTLLPETRTIVIRRMHEVCEHIGRLHDARIELNYVNGVGCTFNHEAQTGTAIAAARDVAGEKGVDTSVLPTMAGEDFSLMLEARPGALIFIGNGTSAGLHHPDYDFNDDTIAAGVSYWSRLVETRLPA